jgi:hypothetical protein
MLDLLAIMQDSTYGHLIEILESYVHTPLLISYLQT